MRIAIVGCGKIGQTYSAALAELGERVAAVSDLSAKAAENLAKTCGAKPYTDYNEMLERERPELVCVATPTDSHAPIAQVALRAGAHVLCEKPLALSVEEAEELVRLAEQSGKVLSVGFKFRFEHAHRCVKDLLDSGFVGEPKHLVLTYFQPLPDRDWYLDEGVIPNLLSHVMDLIRWYFGSEPSRIRAQSLRRLGRKGEDYAMVEVQWDDDRRAAVFAGYYPEFPPIAGTRDMVFQVTGSRGYVVCQRPDTLILCNAQGSESMKVAPNNAFRDELDALLKHLRGHGPLAVTGRDGLQAQKMQEAALNSAASGGDWVPL